jgi:hypothetical protein
MSSGGGKMKKLIVFLLIVTMCMMPTTAYAGYTLENGEWVLTPDSYTEDGKIKVRNPYDKIPDLKLSTELPRKDANVPELRFFGIDGEHVTGTMTYPNIDDMKPGIFELQWVFTPDDDKYETVSGVFEVTVFPEDSEESKGKMPELEPDVPTVPSLTATTVSLVNRTAYDINLNDKVSGCKYKWTSNNPEVAKVNPKNGLVTAVSEGAATITCEITFPDETKQTLISEVVVGYDDNAPELTDTILDLNPGDEYDINVENKVAKSKYRWASSDRSILTVNSANGMVNAKAAGEAYVTCTITTPENQVIVLRCDINVTEPKEIK